MAKIFIFFVTKMVVVSGMSFETRLRKLETLANMVQVADSQLAVLDRMDENTDFFPEPVDFLTENEPEPNFLSRKSRFFRSERCALMLGNKCIPRCRRYYGKNGGRPCNSREMRQHLLFYLS